MVILKSLDLSRDKKNFKGKLQARILTIHRNLPEKLHQGEFKQSKGAKICATTRWEIECEKSSKCFCKIFGRQNMQNQINTKIPKILRTFLNQLKSF